jgi:hypothetical protein
LLVYDTVSSSWENKQIVLGDISDIDLSSLQDSDIIRYDSSTQTWLPYDNKDVVRFNRREIISNYTFPIEYNGFSVGDISISEDIVITLPDGAVWAIL